ncbi:zinc-binding dehydrogenase, partial [Streptomyces sp. NPDC127074]|uniref:zinc-binding dehydrogenase n=1 Tax=Streptomyces sp. NPDC127074 TaxID=3347130 RepID=UPI00365F3648
TSGASPRRAPPAAPRPHRAGGPGGGPGFWLTPLITRDGAGGRALEELLDLTARGRLRPLVGGEYDLGRASDAHADLLGRRTKGKLVLLP